MEFTNISDPAGVKALLDQLRSSQAWQTIASTPEPQSSSSLAADDPQIDKFVGSRPSEEPTLGADGDGTYSTTTVASLLSQLQAASQLNTLELPPRAANPIPLRQQTSTYLASSQPPHASGSSAPRPLDLRSCTFQQALPYIAQLSQDRRLVKALRNMKQEQSQLEKRLWEERQAIQRKHEDRVQVARTKANLIGAGLTQFEADSMMDSFRRELQKFDAERALSAWDGLLAKQQVSLESLGVPTMFPTMTAEELKLQQKVLQVLEGAIE